jgi:hypothetical protein
MSMGAPMPPSADGERGAPDLVQRRTAIGHIVLCAERLTSLTRTGTTSPAPGAPRPTRYQSSPAPRSPAFMTFQAYPRGGRLSPGTRAHAAPEAPTAIAAASVSSATASGSLSAVLVAVRIG